MHTKKLERQPVILVTNDDGVSAKGLQCLIEMVKPFGKVIAVAPKEGHSGMSHAITIKHPLRIRKHEQDDGVELYSVNGTPVDCVKLAMSQVLKSPPDLIVSGINHGSNSSVSIFYSGTMAAVIEGCLYGIPSIGFSLLDYMPDADFTAVVEHGKPIVEAVLARGLSKGTCLNVNFPAIPSAQIKGIKVVRQNMGTWREEFEKRTDPRGYDYFWLTGYYHNEEPNATDTDEYALNSGFISVVPISIDLTNYKEMDALENELSKKQTVRNEEKIR
ncbi:MAG TPA: 5'/3'-nucleotidase SurE [Tenuifilaceae bacterium]|nr:5'/3'-nucleotidase SurE [Bacteroidales bacterium]MDI9516711.1 5'/3'-nucleotidase SurE [Bacteroidota bacterium]OQC61007.1 MAG: 5'-nucleotidase SurE [Bacteroidetes bacterium ADurb.Bin008]HNV82021.1 5'/3'-nucleotidase SurE [Tenuifilaceae bacterium]HOF92008.1 5'/3'-nucleotidase SurE [Tenuifilaceae bacterium]